MVMMRKELYRTEMVADEIQKQPKHSYIALGKAFVLSDYDDLVKTINAKREALNKDITKLEPMDTTLAQRVNETQEKMFKQVKEAAEKH